MATYAPDFVFYRCRYQEDEMDQAIDLIVNDELQEEYYDYVYDDEYPINDVNYQMFSHSAGISFSEISEACVMPTLYDVCSTYFPVLALCFLFQLSNRFSKLESNLYMCVHFVSASYNNIHFSSDQYFRETCCIRSSRRDRTLPVFSKLDLTFSCSIVSFVSHYQLYIEQRILNFSRLSGFAKLSHPMVSRLFVLLASSNRFTCY